MAKSDLLKEAIADAKAVKETALANAKIALQEAFAPRIESMLAAKLRTEIEGDEEEVEFDAEEMPGDEMGGEEMPGDEMIDNMPDTIGVGVDYNNDGDYDFTGELPAGGEEEEVEGEEEISSPDEMADEYNEAYDGHEGTNGDELELEAIIRELEGDLDSMETSEEDSMKEPMMGEGKEEDEDDVNESIDEIIEAILREEEMEDEKVVEEGDDSEKEEMKEELEEAYATVRQLQNILSEVNLLNAKLLYTNKLFRNFELSEAQKMKVIENFDRAGNTREVKLVFTTLAESFNKPKTKRVVKESYASKPAASTAPSKETTRVLSEGFEMAERWKKLAGLL